MLDVEAGKLSLVGTEGYPVLKVEAGMLRATANPEYSFLDVAPGKLSVRSEGPPMLDVTPGALLRIRVSALRTGSSSIIIIIIIFPPLIISRKRSGALVIGIILKRGGAARAHPSARAPHFVQGLATNAVLLPVANKRTPVAESLEGKIAGV